MPATNLLIKTAFPSQINIFPKILFENINILKNHLSKKVFRSNQVFVKRIVFIKSKNAAKHLILFTLFIVLKSIYLSNKLKQILFPIRIQFKMLQKHGFLYVLFILMAVRSQVITPVSNCFGNCTSCEPNNLTYCKGPSSCEWGYYMDANQNCIQIPSIQVLKSQLGERQTGIQPNNITGSWGQQTKVSVCEYNSIIGKKFIDVIGLNTGVTMLEKTYSVDSASQVFYLSFNLLRSQWVPFEDFLLIDISSNERSIQLLEISYETTKKVESSPTIITCGEVRVMSQKFNIKIVNTGLIGQKLTVVFTSFLLKSKWALTNLKLISGCSNFSMYNETSKSCTTCDKDSYLAVPLVGSQWCQKCPSLCQTCTSNSICKTCLAGAVLNQNNLCQFPSTDKIQTLTIQNSTTSCGNSTFYSGSTVKPITFSTLNNYNQQLYDQLQLQFTFYYSPKDWTNSSSKLSLTANNIQMFTFDHNNFTNRGTTKCEQFSQNKMASIQIITPKVNFNDNKIDLKLSLKSRINATFGVSDIQVKSLRKQSTINTNITDFNRTSTLQSHITDKANQLNMSNAVKPNEKSITPQIMEQKISTIQLITNNISSKNSSSPAPNSNQPITQPAVLYVPSSAHQVSGLEVVVNNVNLPINNQITVSIDKLNSDEYKISSKLFQNNNLYLHIDINNSFIDGQLTVYHILSQRLLQSGNKIVIATVQINRFDSLSSNQLSAIDSFAFAFKILAWIGVIGIILVVISGYGVVMEQYVISLQIIFLHVFIASDYIPLTFRDVISGLSITENLNFFVLDLGLKIEQNWLGGIIKNGPMKFFLYNFDINFFREFYPIIIINVIYILWFSALFFIRKYVLRKPFNSEKNWFYRMINNIQDRLINFIDQIWRYQFLATVWLCLVQFYNLVYPEGNRGFQIMNAVLCIISFICTMLWPIFVNIYTTKYYYQNQYSDYLYKFQDIYYKKIPQFFLPSIHHRCGYPIFKFIKLFLTAIFIAYASNVATVALSYLLISNAFEIGYLKFYEILTDKQYMLYKMIENWLFVVIDLILLLLCNFSQFATTQSYIYIGFILAGIAFLIGVNGLVRTGLLIHRKYKDMFEEQVYFDQQKPKTERVV